MNSPQADAADYDLPTSRHAEYIVRAIEASGQVKRRHQFFVWLQSQVGALLPHELAVCGIYARASKTLCFDVFNTLKLPEGAEQAFKDDRSAAMQDLASRWSSNQTRCVLLGTDAVLQPIRGFLKEMGVEGVLVHGVTRPQRPRELESLFMLGVQQVPWTQQHRVFMDLLLPHLHSTYLRMQATEREVGAARPQSEPRRVDTAPPVLTEREVQILSWVREGMNNHQIGTQLGISALTVKNHVQRILRKLSAANRAQAVAVAMGMNLFGHRVGALIEMSTK